MKAPLCGADQTAGHCDNWDKKEMMKKGKERKSRSLKQREREPKKIKIKEKRTETLA